MSEHGYDRTEASLGPLVGFGIALALLIVVSLLVSAWMASDFEERILGESELHPLRELREGPPGPVLQARPTGELLERLHSEESLLRTYGWIDRPNGVVRIPIERALALVAERGVPEWPAPEIEDQGDAPGAAEDGE